MALDVGNMNVYRGESHVLPEGHYANRADEFDANNPPHGTGIVEPSRYFPDDETVIEMPPLFDEGEPGADALLL